MGIINRRGSASPRNALTSSASLLTITAGAASWSGLAQAAGDETSLGLTVVVDATTSVVNSIVQSSGAAFAVSSFDALRDNVVDADCVSQATCDISTDAQLDACAWATCTTASGNHLGDAFLDPASPWGATPMEDSPAIDAAGDASDLGSFPSDLHGHPRPQGASDIGAVERVTP